MGGNEGGEDDALCKAGVPKQRQRVSKRFLADDWSLAVVAVGKSMAAWFTGNGFRFC